MRAARDGFVLDDDSAPILGDIARRLDGIPLALELVAPKIAVLTIRVIAARLSERFRLLTSGSRTAPPRQQTMRAVIDWSYELLSERERVLFARLAVFSSGWTLAAASAVCCDETIDAWDVLELLGSLVRKSLVVADVTDGSDRYRFLETTREYAKERLGASGEAETIALAHARACADHLAEAGSLWDAMDDRAWQRAVASDLDNVRAAFDWAIARPDTAPLAIRILFEVRQARLVVNLPEALRRIETALACAHVPDAGVRAGLLTRKAALLVYSGASVDEFVGGARLALDAARSAGDDGLIVQSTLGLAIAVRAAGELDEADVLLAALATSIDERRFPRSYVELLSDWGTTALLRGELPLARERFSRALAGAKSGSLVYATTLAHLAEVEALMSDLAAARTAALAAKETFAELGSHLNVGVIGNNLAAYAIAADDFDAAFAHLAEALQILRDFGSRTFFLQSIEHHALLAALLGEHDTALRLFGFTDLHFSRIGAPRAGVDLTGYRRLLAIFEREIDQERRIAGLARGSLLDDETAVAHARALHQGRTGSQVAL